MLVVAPCLHFDRILACTKSNSIVSLLAQKGENMSALKCPEKCTSLRGVLSSCE